jgi:hypothetical protein
MSKTAAEEAQDVWAALEKVVPRVLRAGGFTPDKVAAIKGLLGQLSVSLDEAVREKEEEN